MQKTAHFAENQQGFTLIELVLVISLLIIAIGISSDIIVSLVRSYNKAQVMNEVEQTANFVMARLEKEVRAGYNISSPASGACATAVTFNGYYNSANTTYTYSLTDNKITETATGGLNLSNDLTENSTTGGGVSITCTSGSNCFCFVSSDPDVLQINLKFSQANASGSPIFQNSVDLSSTVVLRGSY